jgi:superfamily I DNA and/or RNA helicase
VAALDAVSKLRQIAGDNGQGELASDAELFRQALRLAPIWITTAQNTRAIPLAPHLFDLVVIDEASQCTLTNLLPIIYRAKRLVVIGDPQQLPAITVVGPSEERPLAEQFGVRKYMGEFGHDRRDLYTVARDALPRGAADVVMLDEHYRSDPLIIGFANRYVYQRQLKLRRAPAGRIATGVEPGVHRVHVEGQARRGSGGGSWVNEQEARVVVDQVRALCAAGIDPASIGVVTPFAGQKRRIRDLLEDVRIGQVLVDTAFGFQGDERDVIVFSAVVSPGVPAGTTNWVEQPPNLLNVALTRAKDVLYVVANFAYCAAQSGMLRDLALYLRDVDALRNSHRAELALFNWMVMEGWAPGVHANIGSERVSFTLAEAFEHRVAVIVRALTYVESPRTETERARDATLAAAGYRVVEAVARDVLETPTAVIHRIREELRG